MNKYATGSSPVSAKGRVGLLVCCWPSWAGSPPPPGLGHHLGHLQKDSTHQLCRQQSDLTIFAILAKTIRIRQVIISIIRTESGLGADRQSCAMTQQQGCSMKQSKMLLASEVKKSCDHVSDNCITSANRAFDFQHQPVAFRMQPWKFLRWFCKVDETLLNLPEVHVNQS